MIKSYKDYVIQASRLVRKLQLMSSILGGSDGWNSLALEAA